jgi:uncharacterized membrane-anchored protein YitT (DUF2179 family)
MYSKRVKFYSDWMRARRLSFYKRLWFIFCGVSLVAMSLQLFLVKNFVIDGGIIGISILLSHITEQEVGLYLLILNTPFFLIAYSYLGRRFVGLSFFAIMVLSVGTHLLEPFPAITHNPFLVVIFGGFCLGLGVGITIRFGGCLDGTEVIAILLSKNASLSIGQFILLVNLVIFGISIFILGINEALYSLATYLIAYKTIDFSIQFQ